MFAGPQGTNILPMTEKQIDRFINSKKSTVQSNDEKKNEKKLLHICILQANSFFS